MGTIDIMPPEFFIYCGLCGIILGMGFTCAAYEAMLGWMREDKKLAK